MGQLSTSISQLKNVCTESLLSIVQEIKDPADKKPSDWVDDSMMDDPEDKKPADWVTPACLAKVPPLGG